MTDDCSFDALTGLAHLLHVREVRFERYRGAQWVTDHESKHGDIPFHIVTDGACVIDLVESTRAVRLEAGDLAVLPHGSRHLVTGSAPLFEASQAARVQVIGGRLALEQSHENCVLAALPDIIVVRSAENGESLRLRRLVAAIGDELDAGRAGARAIASELASALFMMIVRIHFDREHVVEGLLRILSHRQAARAVEAMLNTPSRAWTLDELAGYASASRASLVRMFQKTVRMAPLEFLAELRLSLARRRLSATNLPLAAIAAEIGYGSESSFSRAFRRRFGMPPGEVRAGAITAIRPRTLAPQAARAGHSDSEGHRSAVWPA